MRKTVRSISEKKLLTIIISMFAATAVVATAAAFGVRYFAGKGKDVSSQISSAVSTVPVTETVSSSIASEESKGIVYESDDGTNFSVPDSLRAVFVKPGQDFLLKTTDSDQTVKNQIDTAMQQTAKLGFNSVIIFTETSQGVLFSDSDLKQARQSFDVLAYAIKSAKEHKLYSYAVYPVLLSQKDEKNELISDFSKKNLQMVSRRAGEFAKKYQPSGIVFDKYEITKTDVMKKFYDLSGSDKSCDDFLRENVTLCVRNARNAIRKNNNTSQTGFLTGGVWANSSVNKNGSATSAEYQSYSDGFADTRDWILNEKLNFVMVKNYMPTDSVKNNFSTIAKWWSNLCSQSNTAFYNIHASSKLTSGPGEFSSPDQLIKQVSVVKPLKAYGGSGFDSLSALLADKDGSTTLLLKYFSNQIKNSFIFNKLSMSSPTSNSVTTYNSTISFTGATDPNFTTTFNGQALKVTANGYFSFDVALKIGTNTFKISHKGKTVTYTVLRKVKLIESVSPTGTVQADGGTAVVLSVKGYTGSKITAKIAGSTVALTELKSDRESEEADNSSQYVTFSGEYRLPAATENVRNLGAVTFTASWQGFSESAYGASIKVLAKPKVLTPQTVTQAAIQVKTALAETFPTDRLNDQSQPYCYPLPAGTIDYIVGNELVFNSTEGTFKYYKLQSGHRVYSKDITMLGNRERVSNKISAVNVSYDGRNVNLDIENSWSVPFKYIESTVSYDSLGAIKGDYNVTEVTYRMFYTDAIDLTKVTVNTNPLIKEVKCSLKKVTVEGVDIPVCDVTLELKTKGGYFGATPSYKNQNKTLNLRLNTPAPIQVASNSYGYTLKGSVIIIDAGHDKLSPGASGVIRDPITGAYKYQEYLMNEAVREQVVSILKELDATVITVDNSVMRTAAQRLSYFQSVNPHLMICIHHNSSTASSACGPEGYFFNAYSQLLCKNIMNSVSGSYVSTSNRAQVSNFGRLKMTREQYYPSMLIECGFISNAKQQEDLIKPENQQKLASLIVKGMINYFASTGSLNY